jgi:hypothetical protein
VEVLAMRSMIAALVLFVPGTALAVIGSGDLVYHAKVFIDGDGGTSLVAVDTATGDRTVISGCVGNAGPVNNNSCGDIVGEGPNMAGPGTSGSSVTFSGGYIWVHISRPWNTSGPAADGVIYRVDPNTGDRAWVSGCLPFDGCVGSGPIPKRGSFGLTAFPLDYAPAFPAWALGTLAALLMGSAGWGMARRRHPPA